MIEFLLKYYRCVVVFLILACIFVFAFLIDYVLDDVNDERLGVHFLDVGQGDSIFIKTPSQKTVLIDGGKFGSGVVKEMTQFLPFDERELDVLMITHFDFDHSGGLIDVLKYFDVNKVIISKNIKENEFVEYLQGMIEKEDSEVLTVYNGDKIDFGDGVEMEFLSPAKDGLYFSDNQSSIVSKLVYKDKSFLFTGDIDDRIERSLVSRGLDIRADVLKVSHHGSKSSSLQEFIDAVDPSISIIQVGKNRYGHPHTDVLEKLNNSIILRNDKNGTISFYF